MNQGKFLQSIQETTWLNKYKLSFLPSGIEAYYCDLFIEQGGLKFLTSKHYLLHIIFADYISKTILTNAAALFLGFNPKPINGGPWLGGHDVSDLCGDFIMHKPRVEDQVFKTDILKDVSKYLSDKGNTIDTVYFGLDADLKIAKNIVLNCLKSNVRLRIFGQISGAESQRFFPLLSEISPNGKVRYWSKIALSGKYEAEPKRHLFYWSEH